MKQLSLLFAAALIAVLASCATKTPVRTQYSLAGSPLMSARALTASLNAHMATPEFVARTRLSEPLRLERGVPPLYPDEARRQRLEGTVIMQITVTESGDIKSATVKSAAHDILGQATRLAVSEWKFSAPQRNGQPTTIQMELPLVFRLARG
jgi:periplasmic protein TonB